MVVSFHIAHFTTNNKKGDKMGELKLPDGMTISERLDAIFDSRGEELKQGLEVRIGQMRRMLEEQVRRDFFLSALGGRSIPWGNCQICGGRILDYNASIITCGSERCVRELVPFLKQWEVASSTLDKVAAITETADISDVEDKVKDLLNSKKALESLKASLSSLLIPLGFAIKDDDEDRDFSEALRVIGSEYQRMKLALADIAQKLRIAVPKETRELCTAAAEEVGRISAAVIGQSQS